MVKLRKQEQGRSMVEMLGVLAIIGVLSVAGIAGYSMAMRNHRANEIANAASMLYIMGIAQNQGNGDTDLGYTSATGTNLPAGTSAMAYVGNTKSVTITMKNADDCTIVADKLGGTCNGASLTVNFGGTAVVEEIEERPEFTGSCPDGWFMVSAPNEFCAKNPQDATAECISRFGTSEGVTEAREVSPEQYGGYTFICQ